MRDVGTLSANDLGDPRIRNYAFVKFTFPSPTGIVRLTGYPEGAGWTGDIDGTGSFAWSNTRPVREGTITLGRDNTTAITTFQAANVDYYFDDLARLHGSLSEIPVELWRGHFDKDDVTVFDESVFLYKGEVGRYRLDEWAEFSLNPLRSATHGKYPRTRFIAPTFKFLPRPDLKITWGGVSSTPPGPIDPPGGPPRVPWLG